MHQIKYLLLFYFLYLFFLNKTNLNPIFFYVRNDIWCFCSVSEFLISHTESHGLQPS